MKTCRAGKIKIQIKYAKCSHLFPGGDYRDKHLLVNWLSVLAVISPAQTAWTDA